MRRWVAAAAAFVLTGAAFSASAPEVGASEGMTWVRTGGPLGGLGYDVRMVPDAPDSMFVTDAFAGVHLSLDGGRTWSPSNAGIDVRTGPTGDAIPIFCLTIDPNDPSIIWAGTQNARGIFRSPDGGQTWEKRVRGIIEDEGITFRGISVDPTDSDVVYAAAELASWAGGGEPQPGREFDRTRGVVYKSTDGGQNWSRIWRGDNLARYVLVNPRDTEVLYVSTGIFDREAANSDPGPGTPGGVGVLKSTDGGTTWREANAGLGNLYVGSLFMHPTDPDVLLAATGNNQYFLGGGVYRTEDGAESWDYVLLEHHEGGRPVGNVNSVEFAVSDPDIAYAASAGAVYRSEDGGRSWTKVTAADLGWGPDGIRAGFPIDIQVDPRNADRLFINNYGGGNFVSTDGGVTWAVASGGYTGAAARSIAVDPDEPGRAYAASRSGLFLTTDGGTTWQGRAFPPEAMLEFQAVAASRSGDRVIAATNWAQGVATSTDAGATWSFRQLPLADNQGVRSLAFSPTDPNIAFAGVGAYFSAGGFDASLPAGGVYRSFNGGRTWREANDAVSATRHVLDLGPDPQDPDRWFAATGTGLIRTDDAGGSWHDVAGLPGGVVGSVAIHPHDPALVLAGLAPGGVYRSDDGGATWSQSSAGLSPESAVLDLAFDPATAGVVYAADFFGGAFRSDDGGATWSPINDGLEVRALRALAVSDGGRHVYAATEGGGVYRLDVDGSPPAKIVVAAPPTSAPPTTAAPPATTTSEPAPAGTAPPAETTATTALAAAPEDDGGGAATTLIVLGLAVAAALGLGVTVGRRMARR